MDIKDISNAGLYVWAFQLKYTIFRKTSRIIFFKLHPIGSPTEPREKRVRSEGNWCSVKQVGET